MSVEINITNDDIEYAERILFADGQTFDDERRQFIKNLDTIDLQAVPGSGKTTALLAKLLILERYMPFADSSGILVISHTNSAIEEIKEKLQKHCPRLFRYPNFVGTIQSFVDQFLAIPCGHNLLNTRLSWIDTERYRNRLYKKFKRIYWAKEYDKPGTMFYGRHKRRAEEEAAKKGRTVKELCDGYTEQEVKKLFFDFCDGTIKLIDNKTVILKAKTNKKFIGIRNIILETISEGIISYEYAFNIARFYLKKCPKVKKLLQDRFKLVFVDEMQDMNSDHLDVLEQIFFDNGKSTSKFQRIGDKNQAIYSGGAELLEIWDDRDVLVQRKLENRP